MDDIIKHLDELNVIGSSFLNQLNEAIDKVIEEKQKFDIDYHMLEKVLETIIKNQKTHRQGPVDKLIPIKKEKILSVALDFFQSIDNEFYDTALKVIFGQRDRTKMGIYNRHNVQDFNKKDENRLHKYTKDGNVETYYGNSYVHIPLQHWISRKESKLLNEDEGTLEDLYLVVHEISHLFDLNQLDTALTTQEIEQKETVKAKRKVTRELLGEATTIAFEGLLTDYLLQKRLYPEAAIRDRSNIRVNSALGDARITYAKLALAAEKERNGEITLDFLEKMMKQNNMSVQDVRRMARRIVDDKNMTLYRNRYAIGCLVAPTIIKAYKSDKANGTNKLKSYLKAVHDDDFIGALRAIGIELNEQGISTLITNMKAHDAKINESQTR